MKLRPGAGSVEPNRDASSVEPSPDPKSAPRAPEGTEFRSPVPATGFGGASEGGSSDASLEWTAELDARVADEGVEPPELLRWPTGYALEHLARWMALRTDGPSGRNDKVDRIAAFLRATGDPRKVRRWLVDLPAHAPIVDVYPLEVRARIAERWPEFFPDTALRPIFTNGPQLEGAFEPGELIRLRHPVGFVMQSFALEGGGTPEYVLAPGPPGNYGLEWGAPGEHVALFQGLHRGETWIERRRFVVRDAPEGRSGW